MFVMGKVIVLKEGRGNWEEGVYKYDCKRSIVFQGPKTPLI